MLTITNVFAIDGAAPVTKERLDEIANGSDEERIINERIRSEIIKNRKLLNQSSTQSNGEWWIQTLYVPYYAQENFTTCGAACARMVVKYLSGVEYTESSIVSEIVNAGGAPVGGGGLYLKGVMDYVNSKQSVWPYLDNYDKDFTAFTNRLYGTVVDMKCPVIVGVLESASPEWKFCYDQYLGRHFVVINQFRTDKAYVHVMDPYAMFVGRPEYREYTISMQAVYEGYSNANVGYIW